MNFAERILIVKQHMTVIKANEFTFKTVKTNFVMYILPQ